MSGQGKYTNYAPPASDKNTLLGRLFPDAPTAQLVGKEKDALAAELAIAIPNLTPAHQPGDLGYFPKGVDLDFSGKSASVQPPDTTEGKDVTWKNPGDPANSYVPDVSSPGPGKTDGIDKDVDPKIAVKDLNPAYVAGGPRTGTKSPVAAIAKIVAANVLGVSQKAGDSGANS